MSPARIMQEWWGDRIKRRLSLITAALVAITTAMHFGSVAEPYWFATRDFTRQIIQMAEKTTNTRLLALEISTKEASRDNTQAQIDRLEFELKKNPDAPDSLRQLMNEQIRRYQDQLRIINFELDDLRRRLTARGP